MKLILTIFLLFGLLILGIAGYYFYLNQQFQKTALHADGVIIDVLVSEISSKSSDGRSTRSISYFPIVTFATDKGNTIVFKSSIGSSFYKNSKGENVDVIYNRSKPREAKINDTLNGLGPIFFAGMGLVFTLIGFIPMLLTMRENRRGQRLMYEGRPVQAKIIGIQLNTTIEINGCSPYQIICQWLDRSNNTVHRFHSRNIYFDPEPFVKQDYLTVYLDKTNYKKYHMDISFLPKTA